MPPAAAVHGGDDAGRVAPAHGGEAPAPPPAPLPSHAAAASRAPRLRRPPLPPVVPALPVPPLPRRAPAPLLPATAGSPAPSARSASHYASAASPQRRHQVPLGLLATARIPAAVLPPPPPRTRSPLVPALLGSISSLSLLSAIHALLLRLGFLSHHAISLAFLKTYPLPYARVLFDEMPQKNKCTVAYNTVITACFRADGLGAAHHLFDEMQRYKRSRRSVVSWSVMIAGYAWCKKDDIAVLCFERMIREGEVAPDDGTLATELLVCGRLGNAWVGRWAHEHVRKSGLLDRNVHVANAVMDMYFKCGDVHSAMEVFKGMRQRSVVSWNTLISGFSLNGLGIEGIKLYQEMRTQGEKPNEVTFLGVLGCCAHARAVDIGRDIFQSMQPEHGIEPAIEHYGCLVDLLGRSGLLEEAYTLIQGMPLSPNAAIWGALLSACHTHSRISIAEVALKELISLEPWNSGNYVQLANLYAETGRWEEAGDVRRLMRRMSVQKAPGQSLIEEAECHFTNA